MQWDEAKAKQLVLDSQRHRCPPFGCNAALHREWELAFERQDMDEFVRLTKQIMRIRLPRRKLSERDIEQ